MHGMTHSTLAFVPEGVVRPWNHARNDPVSPCVSVISNANALAPSSKAGAGGRRYPSTVNLG